MQILYLIPQRNKHTHTHTQGLKSQPNPGGVVQCAIVTLMT